MISQQEVWDKIAPSWTHYRHTPFKDVEEFAKKVKSTSKNTKVLDVGCGNCRQLLPFIGCDLYGIDFSEKMIKSAKRFCKSKNMFVKLKVGSITNLPYDSCFFDIVLCIAVLHHLKPDEASKAMLEIHRVLKPHGVCLVSVWYKKAFGERFVPWKTKNGTLMRFYRFYSEDELKGIIKSAGFKIRKSWISGDDEKNLFFEIEK